jgi:glycosyltransferase involved in cell wall biosynthesis
MRICYIADANSVHTQRWVKPFVERGDQVYLLSLAPVERAWTGLQEMVDLTQLGNLRKVRFLQWGWWTWRYVRRIKPDILHAHQLTGAGWLGAMAAYHPFVVSAWGSDILVEPHRSVLRRILVRIVLSRCDHLTVPSQPMYDAAVALGVARTELHMIPWGIETGVFRPTPDDRLLTRGQLGIDQDAKVVFCPRAIAPLYNLDIVLEAFNAAQSQIREARLLLLHYNVDPRYREALERKISAYGLDDTVLWLPTQRAAPDMARLYRASDIVVSIPSSEGYGLTVYEAMAAGCPTLISDLPIFSEELIHGLHTMKVAVRDRAQTSKTLLDLLANPELRQELRQNALGLCTWKNVQRRIELIDSLYGGLLDERFHESLA